MSKLESAYKTIGEVVKIIGLKSKRGDVSPTHTIRYWEKEFKQIKPKILNGNRRYYDKKNIDLIRKVHFLLKDQGMTIKGVKKILNNVNTFKLDENSNEMLPIPANKSRTFLPSIEVILHKILNKPSFAKSVGGLDFMELGAETLLPLHFRPIILTTNKIESSMCFL